MWRRSRWWSAGLLPVLFVLGSETPIRGADSPRAAALDRTSLPATGRQEALLTVAAFGRYAVTVASAQGTALQLIDRMAGPGAIDGEAGTRDGRVDAFLDRGDYKIVAIADAKGTGTAVLKAHAFVERNAPQPPMLVELKPVDGTLNDFEQISYWIEVKERRTVAIEAAGRDLADLRLWTSGDWLVDVTPEIEIVTPVDGRPLKICRLTADLNPGFYLLSAYGGAPQPWAQDNGEHPFYLRYGIPRLASVIRQRFTIGPSGIDRWRVPGETNYYRVELPEARPLALQVGTYSSRRPFDAGSSPVTITKQSLVPVAEVETGRLLDDHIVTVTGAAGQPYILQHFDVGERFWCGGHYWRLHDNGPHWVSTVHSGDPTDSIDATALVTRWKWWTQQDRHTEPFLDEVVDLGTSATWARHFNLLERATIFLHVRDTGRYTILARGSKAQFRIEPFMTERPAEYRSPDFQSSGSEWDLEAGYYVLTADPIKLGILDVAVVPAASAATPNLLADLIGKGRGQELTRIRAAAQWPAADLADGYSYDLFLNEQPDVHVGLILRKLPIDLTDPLPVRQMPNEKLSVPIHIGDAGQLAAIADDDSVVELSADGGAWQRTLSIAAGDHRLAMRHASPHPLAYTLRVEPDRLRAAAPLPPLPDPSAAAPPKLPVLSSTTPRFIDLDRGESATFYVRADRPALYRIESSGLLATAGNIRTRTITSLDRDSENGVGRNFFLEQYLREGDYQITTTTLGKTKGHLGLTLERAEIIDGGVLSDGFPARVALPAGSGIVYTFTIRTAGQYRLRAMGVGKTFRCRLEDGDGWPIEPPNIAADLNRHFDAGAYRLVLLPQNVESRRVTLLESVPEPVEYKGHGPHALPLARRASAVWTEPEGDAPRTPDTWELSVPADVDARIELSGEMQAELKRVQDDGTAAVTAAVPPLRGWKGRLGAGRYRLEVVCARTNNKQPYEVAVWPEQLVAGLARNVSAPARVPVAVGRDGLVELSSFGSADVSARLYDRSGQLVVAADDAPGDWNFHIAQPLRAGNYELQIDPVGTRSATATEVSMRAPGEHVEARLSTPVRLTAALADTVRIYPLQVAPDEEILFVTAQAAESVGCAIESLIGDQWQTIAAANGQTARLEIPLPSAANGQPMSEYRLRLWSAEGRPTAVKLDVVTITPPWQTETQLAKGVPLAPVPGLKPRIGVAAVKLDRPGMFRVRGPAVRWSSSAGQPSQMLNNGLVAASGRLLWLVRDLPADASADVPTVRAQRERLAPGSDHQLALTLRGGAPIACDVARSAPGPLLAMATAMVGQPGIRIAAAGDVAPAGDAMAAGDRTALAVSLAPASDTAVVWPAAGADDIDVRIEQMSFPPPPEERMGWGVTSGNIEPATARSFALPPGNKRIRFVFGDSVVAALSDGASVRSVHWAGGTAFEESLDSTADHLTLMVPRGGSAPFDVELLPVAAKAESPAAAKEDTNAAINPGRPLEERQVDAGRRRVPVASTRANQTLHVRGARGDALYVRHDGTVSRGSDVAAGGGGTLLIPHAPGLVLAWLDSAGDGAVDLFGGELPPDESPIDLPATIRLAANPQVTNRVQVITLNPATPIVLHARSATAMITRFTSGDGAPMVAVDGDGLLFDGYLPAGRSQLALRAIAGEALSGTVELTSTEVTPIAEGLGPELLLPSGATRFFSFTVSRTNRIGIGVRAVPDVADCTLLDQSGRPLGSGVVQMPMLDAGTYLLKIHVPETAPPTRVRPAVAGIETAPSGPPADVIRGYLALAGASAPVKP